MAIEAFAVRKEVSHGDDSEETRKEARLREATAVAKVNSSVCLR